MIKASSVNLQKLAFNSELDLSIMFFILITIHVLVVQIIKFTTNVRIETNFLFYLCSIIILMIISNLIKINTVDGFKSKEVRIYLIFSFFYAIFEFVVVFGFKDILFFDFQTAFSQFNNHISIIFIDFELKNISFSFETFLIISVLLTGLFAFSLVPSAIRFGACYLKILKESYKEVEEASSKNSEKPKEDENKLNLTQFQNKSKYILRVFNLRLVFNLLALFLWIKPLVMPWIGLFGEERSIFTIRIIFCVIYAVLVILVQKYEIEIYLSNIYETIKGLLTDQSDKNLLIVRNKSSLYLQALLIVTYQIVAKFIIPLLLIFIILNKNSLGAEFKEKKIDIRLFNNLMGKHSKNNEKIENFKMFTDFNCPINRNLSQIFWQTRNCPIDVMLIINKVEFYGGIYIKEKINMNDNFLGFLKELMRKINLYGLVPEGLYQEVFSFWLFQFFLVNYVVTIFYILFLRKTYNL